MSSEFPSSLRDGRYAVVGLIAEGSQGATLDAVDKRAGRSVAIKRFQVKGARGWKDVELAEREAAVLSRISHRHLPAYLDHFEEDGALYLVMEKVEGRSLATLRKERDTLSRDEVVAFLHDAAGVLGYLHGLDPPVIHRDIKPGNVIRRPDGSFVLVDFGSVRAHLAPKGGSTVVGTFGYMAPEQLQGRALPATDIYSVGATALTLLTGTEPEDLPHKGLAIDVAKALADRAEPALVAAIGAMVEPDPERRAPSLAPLLARLPRASAAAAATDPRVRSAAQPPPNVSASSRAAPDQPASASRRSAPPPVGGHFVDPPGPSTPVAAAGSGWSVPAIVGFATVLALTLLRVGVALALRVTVPLVLVLLSIFFGRSMVQAARDVRQAGRRAGQQLKQWQGSVRRAGADGPTGRRREPRGSSSPGRRGWSAAASSGGAAAASGGGAAAASGGGAAAASGGGAAADEQARRRSRVRFEAPSATAAGSGGRGSGGRRRDGRFGQEPPSAAAGPRVEGSSESAPGRSAGRVGATGLREAIDEIEDAVDEVDQEVRRRRG